MTASKIDVTPAAADLLRTLAGKHGPLMFHQSGGCCDGSSPMCYPVGMFRTGASDVHLGDLAVDGFDPVPVYMSASQYELWKFTHITIDLVDGRGSGFSVEAPEGKRFLIRSRMLTDEEVAELGITPRFPLRAQPLPR
ncbi:DUF779 domain-containing protein [Amnibacterium setariae]|uniref:DUF779 domain-containing protein n=1 Tax=Amnibacterium setariae TaxID=2306585 RepID=A0A3A1U4C5_9MICO|nr:DUF779 domain-containing protein [Amnibacterium setariae]RIX31192.1 DUF779 domain-containing protein [Amnibacterium setariae]